MAVWNAYFYAIASMESPDLTGLFVIQYIIVQYKMLLDNVFYGDIYHNI